MQGGVKIQKKFYYSSVVTWDGLQMQKQANWPHGRSPFYSEGTKNNNGFWVQSTKVKNGS